MRRRWTRWHVLGAVALVLVLAVEGRARIKKAARSAVGWWSSRARSKQAVPERPFGLLAASQVGYGPAMQKRFSSPRPFQSFQVVRDPDGAVVLSGGPLCELPTPGLGPVATVTLGDFSALDAPGRYHLVAGELSSHSFQVGAEVFDRPVRAAQRAFYFQRAFTAIDPAHAEGPWIHGSDAPLAPPGVRAGWHDAGDFSIYSASLNTALYWMLEAYEDFAPSADDTNIPESGNGIPDLLDEARWGLEWLLSTQDPSGGFRNSTCEERYGPYGTNWPERMPPYRAGEVGTLATARAVGLLAYGSTVWRRFDAAFANRALQAALAGDRYLQQHPESSDGPTCPPYRADGDENIGRHTRMLAAAGLLLATGEARYRDDFERSFLPLDHDPSYMHTNGFAAQIYLRAPGGSPSRKAAVRASLRGRAEWSIVEGRRNAFEHSAPTFWGSIGAGFTRTGSYNVKRCLERGMLADCDQAAANVHYALGRNYLHLAYVSGLPGVTHGRVRAFHHWLAALRAEPFLPPGLVAGGPNDSPEALDTSNPRARPIPIWGYWGDPAFPRKADTPFEMRYTDNDSWSTNEVSLDWQASTLYSLYFAQWVARNPLTRRGPAPLEPPLPDGKVPRCDERPDPR